MPENIGDNYRNYQLNKARAAMQYVQNTVGTKGGGLMLGYVVAPITNQNRVLDKYNVYLPDKHITVVDVPRLRGDGSGGPNGTGNKPFPLVIGQPVVLQFNESTRKPLILATLFISGKGTSTGTIPHIDYKQVQDNQLGHHYPPYNQSSEIYNSEASLSVGQYTGWEQSSPYDNNSQIARETQGNFTLDSTTGAKVEGVLGNKTTLAPSIVIQASGTERTLEQKANQRLQYARHNLKYRLEQALSTMYTVDEGKLFPTTQRPLDQQTVQELTKARQDYIEAVRIVVGLLKGQVVRALQDNISWSSGLIGIFGLASSRQNSFRIGQANVNYSAQGVSGSVPVAEMLESYTQRSSARKYFKYTFRVARLVVKALRHFKVLKSNYFSATVAKYITVNVDVTTGRVSFNANVRGISIDTIKKRSNVANIFSQVLETSNQSFGYGILRDLATSLGLGQYVGILESLVSLYSNATNTQDLAGLLLGFAESYVPSEYASYVGLVREAAEIGREISSDSSSNSSSSSLNTTAFVDQYSTSSLDRIDTQARAAQVLITDLSEPNNFSNLETASQTRITSTLQLETASQTNQSIVGLTEAIRTARQTGAHDSLEQALTSLTVEDLENLELVLEDLESLNTQAQQSPELLSTVGRTEAALATVYTAVNSNNNSGSATTATPEINIIINDAALSSALGTAPLTRQDEQKLALAKILAIRGIEYSGALVTNLDSYYFTGSYLALAHSLVALTYETREAQAALLFTLFLAESPVETLNNLAQTYSFEAATYAEYIDLANNLVTSLNRTTTISNFLNSKGLSSSNFSQDNLVYSLKNPEGVLTVLGLETKSWARALVTKDYRNFMLEILDGAPTSLQEEALLILKDLFFI